ncbi:MAG TPA: flagellar basal body P-ring formation chaperone FlgA [Tepidisphaeraceae bacterium]|jgi:flagella basal body P-ring formation protein FlgA
MYPVPALQKTLQLMVLLTLLAWATQLLFSSWARGDEPAPAGTQYAQVPVELGGSEKFVPGGERFYAGATLELRGEVNVIGEEVKLRQVCRWSDSDKAAFEPIADLVLVRLARKSPYRTLTVRELRDTLHDAGVNLGVVRFAGATSCTVARTDVKFDERSALEEWIANKETAAAKPPLIQAPTSRPTKAMTAPPAASAPAKSIPSATAESATLAKAVDEPKPYKSLKEYLVAEASERLNLPPEQLQFHFNPADEKLLNLSEPHFEFNVKGPRYKALGDVTWEVSIVADGQSQKASVTANVRAWQNQLVVNKPLGYRQVIRADDLIDRRTLVDSLSDDPLVTREQVVGEMAGRDLKSGTVLTARLIEPTILVKSGQLVSIVLTQGAIQAKSVARAMEQGTFGQSIRVKNEVTNNVFDVIITGAQTARLPGQAPAEKPDVAVLDTNR